MKIISKYTFNNCKYIFEYIFNFIPAGKLLLKRTRNKFRGFDKSNDTIVLPFNIST